MKSKALPSITATVLLLVVLVACYASSSLAAGTSPARAVLACGAIAEGSTEGNTTCALGYGGATNHATLSGSCALTLTGLTNVEATHDCKLGYIIAAGVTQEAPSPSAAAKLACGSISEGATDGSPAACEQGYQDALAGETLEASCTHLGEGAITAVEYVVACEDGWFVGKDEPACIPGSDPLNGQPGSTISADAATDKTCSAA